MRSAAHTPPAPLRIIRQWPALLAVAFALQGCISVPDVVLLDRKTVLEEQASGELHPLENDLRELAIVPKAEDFTRAQLRAAGQDLSRTTLRRIVQIHALLRTEAEYLDDLLVRRCVGEGRDGLLVETPATCAGRTAAARLSAAVHRVNRARQQIWDHLRTERPEASAEDIRRAWRARHLRAVVCDGQVQSEAGVWAPKRC